MIRHEEHKKTLKIETECADDVLLLLAHIKRMNLASLLDKHIPAHGNRKGPSVGEVTVVWLSPILSEANHRMNHVQEWSKQRTATSLRDQHSSAFAAGRRLCLHPGGLAWWVGGYVAQSAGVPDRFSSGIRAS
jgi:hypothetical protein